MECATYGWTVMDGLSRDDSCVTVARCLDELLVEGARGAPSNVLLVYVLEVKKRSELSSSVVVRSTLVVLCMTLRKQTTKNGWAALCRPSLRRVGFVPPFATR